MISTTWRRVPLHYNSAKMRLSFTVTYMTARPIQQRVAAKVTFRIKRSLGEHPKYEPVTPEARALVRDFFAQHRGHVLVLTGAGVSTDSGIPDYRSPNGTYVKHPQYRSILFHEFVTQHCARQRYWARSFLGIREMEKARPNPTHYAFSRLEQLGYIGQLITQNVDSLHRRAGSQKVLELHGSLRTVRCMGCRRTMQRLEFQEILARLNPRWAEYQALISGGDYGQEQERLAKHLGIRPDGDVDLPPELKFSEFRYPFCDNCGAGNPRSIWKPDIVFFGENLEEQRREISLKLVDECRAMFVCGTSLATYSAYRLVEAALAMDKPVIIATFGPTRADAIATHKVSAKCGELLPPIVLSLPN